VARVRVNYLLILGCIGFSLWAWTQDPNFVDQYLVFSWNNLMAGEVWTLVTALFLHAGPEHLFGNMLFLYVFGNTLEKMIGRNYHLAVFFIGGFTAFLLPPALHLYGPDVGMLGASAAIFTLAACVMLMNPLKFSFLFMAPQGLVAIAYFVLNVILVYDPTRIAGINYDPSIAYVAHIIGFTVGIPFGISWSKRWPRNLLITLGLFGIYLAILAILRLFFGLNVPYGLL
jgi:membrane associated rhomboid family serine protease